MKNLKLKEKLNNIKKVDETFILFVFLLLCIFIGLIYSFSGQATKAYAYERDINSYSTFNDSVDSYANYISDLETYINEIENSLNFDFSIMKKTEILDKIENLKTITICMQNLGLENSQLYLDIKNKLNECYDILENKTYLYPYTYDDYNLLAYVIMREAGDSSLLDEHRDLVGLVVLNRLNNNGINGDLMSPTIADIINEPGQYPYKSSDINISNIPDYCYESAKRVLEHEVSCPSNVMYQGNFIQGSGIYNKFYSEIYGWTYFCYL